MQYTPFSIHLNLAVRHLRQGGVVAYPTEGVWGLGCDPWNYDAVAKILLLKQRPLHKGLILIAAHPDQLAEALRGLSKAELDQLAQDPGYPVTWLIPHNGSMPAWITGGADTLAVRITRHPLAKALCEALDGPLVSTSANPGGKPAATSALQVRQYFGEHIDHILPGRLTHSGGASEIRDLRSGKILRARSG